MSVAKFTGILLCILLFFGLFAFGPFYDRLDLQFALLLIVMIWSVWRFSWREAWTLLKFSLPFVGTLFFIGLLFHLTRFQGREDWLYDTLIKCFLFPSSVVFLKTILSYITYLDILKLPLSMSLRIDLMTMKSAFQKGGRALERFSWYLDTYPYLCARSPLRYRVQKYASLIIALYLYLYKETEHAHLLLQNRYHHLGGLP